MCTCHLLPVACAFALAACADEVPAAHAEPHAAGLLQGGQPHGMLRAQVAHSASGLVPERLPDGSTRVRLKGRYLSLAVVNDEGQQTCVDSPALLDRMLSHRR